MSALVLGLLVSEAEQGDVVVASKVPDVGDELTGEVAQERGRSDGIAAVLGEKAHQAGAMLEGGYVAVEIEPVQGLELESDVAFEKIADVRWSIHATRVGQRCQWAIPSMRQAAYSSSASKRPLRSQRRIIPQPTPASSHTP